MDSESKSSAFAIYVCIRSFSTTELSVKGRCTNGCDCRPIPNLDGSVRYESFSADGRRF